MFGIGKVVTVADPQGAQWTVRRAPIPDMSAASGAEEGLILMWPFWFIAHWLGLPWKIVIHRDGAWEGSESVRGWHKSGRRIQEIAEALAKGTF